MEENSIHYLFPSLGARLKEEDTLPEDDFPILTPEEASTKPALAVAISLPASEKPKASFYGVTLQRKEGAVIGLGIHLPDDNSGVSVKFVQEGGLAAAFNEKNPDLAIKPGDKIVLVNEATQPAEVMKQLRDAQTLSLTLERQ